VSSPGSHDHQLHVSPVCLQVSNMSSLQSISELLLSLDSPELQEAEQVRAAINQQLSTGESLSISTCVYPSLPVSIHLYLSLSIYTCVYPSLPVSIHLYLCLSISTCLYPSLPVSIHLHLCLSISTCVYPSLPVSILLYLCLPFSPCLYSSLPVSTLLYLCLRAEMSPLSALRSNRTR